MKALRYKDPAANSEKLALLDAPQPRIERQDEVLVRVLYAGLCGTDVHIYRGGHPAREGVTLGHECYGVVEQVGREVRDLAAGAPVVIDPNLACDDAPLLRQREFGERCSACRDGLVSQCQWMAQGTTIGIFRDGALAQYVVAPRGALHLVPKELAGRKAAVLAEPLSCIENSIRRIDTGRVRRALVLGAGPMGALYATRLASSEMRVIVVDEDETRLRLVHEMLGEHVAVSRDVLAVADDANVERLRATCVREFGDAQPDLVIDAVGHLADAALGVVRPGGMVVLLGMNQHAPAARVDAYDLVRREKRLVGSYIGKGCFPAALETLAAGATHWERLITRLVGLDDVLQRGFPAIGLDPATGARRPYEALKVVVQLG